MKKTSTSKQTHRPLFLALQADAKKYPGGIRALAEALNLNGHTLANGLNPDHEAPPPSFSTIIEIILLAQGKQAVFAIAQLVDQVPMDLDIYDQHDETSHIKSFLSLVSSASDFLGKGSEAAKDGRFDAGERRDLAPVLLSLMQVTAQLYRSFNND